MTAAAPRTWTIAGRAVRAEVQDLGAMLGPAVFTLGDRTVQPFAVAPWADDPPDRLATLPPLLRRLRGEWPCVPFGMPQPRRDLPPEWLAGLGPDGAPVDDQPHGTPSNAAWSLIMAEPGDVQLALDLPPPHPIERLERRVTADPDAPAIHIALSVLARADADLPIGLHPVFALPNPTRLVFADAARAWTFPGPLEPGISRFLPDQRDADLSRIRLTDDSTVDATRLPLPFDTEDLLMVTGAAGRADLIDTHDGTRVELRWDAAVFPCCVVWFSNRGRTAYPWSGRFLAVGIEPVCAPFDLGILHSRNANSPLARAGIPTFHRFRAGERLDTLYSVTLAVA